MTDLVPIKRENNLPVIQVDESIDDNYSIRKSGAMSYIVNKNGKIVSNVYHEFKLFHEDDIYAMIGQTGAMSKILKLPQNIDDFFEESPTEFHDLHHDAELGLMISTTGAMSYIVEMNTGEIISKGYHSFFRKSNTLYGQTGTTIEKVKLIPKEIETRQIELSD